MKTTLLKMTIALALLAGVVACEDPVKCEDKCKENSDCVDGHKCRSVQGWEDKICVPEECDDCWNGGGWCYWSEPDGDGKCGFNNCG
ncbi:MAG: hypothetical protein PHU25_15830 [Deltaproteobacteria bacterium]|nr:hypothetical protein [Deltaproteobacteria bacterium]